MHLACDFSLPGPPAPSGRPPLQRVPRSRPECKIRLLIRSPEIHDGSTATRLLQPLSGGDGLYLTGKSLFAEALLDGMLDMVAPDVLERGNDPEEARLRVRDANAGPEAYLRHARWNPVRAADGAVLHPLLADLR